MADFNTFFDFDNTDTFLDSISGSLNNLSPSSVSGDETNKIYDVTPVNWEDNIINQDYSNPNIQNNSTHNENNFFNEITQANNTDFQSSSMSSTSYSQDSTSNGISPVSQVSISSVHTSPEPMMVKPSEEIDEIKPILKNNSANKKASKVTKPMKKAKNTHNMIEKKYRNNINSKILALRDAVPALRIAAGNKDVSLADLEGLTPASKLNKASVLTKATEYIKHLEQKNEILRKQNLELQRLIQASNLHPPQPQHSQPGTFGYIPPSNEQSFKTTPAQQSYSSNFVYNDAQQPKPLSQSQQLYQQSNSNKYLLGGMAAIMGTSLFAGDGNDFKGLSALPFSILLPYGLLNPSPFTLQLWNLLKVLLIVGSVISIIYPYIFRRNMKGKERPSEDFWKSWLLVTIGLELPVIINEDVKARILKELLGQSEFSWLDLFNDYILLSISENNFENCFLTLLIGKLLILKYPFVSRFINRNLSIKGSLILNLNYNGEDEALKKLNQLIHKIDGLSLIGSKSLMSRLVNLINHENINYRINDGQNHLKYVELYQNSNQNYYSILVNWRVLELIHQLNLNYLNNLTNDKDKEEKIEQILKDLETIENLILKDSKILNYFKLFKAITNCNTSPDLLNDFRNDVSKHLQNFKIIMEGQELTDHEIFNTSDEDEVESEVEDEVEVDVPPSKEAHDTDFKSQKSLINSLNLVSEEQFIVLTSSLILYYYKKDEVSNSIKLLNYLKIHETNAISLLSFTSLINLIDVLIPGIEDNENLDNLVKLIREWINDSKLSNFMDFKLRSSLSNLIVDKSMILNGIQNDISDEE